MTENDGPLRTQTLRPIDLYEREIATHPRGEALSALALAELATERLHERVTLLDAPALALSARHPHDPAGMIDAYMPARWDCELDLIFMRADFDNNPSAGYVQFTAPADGQYLVAVRLSGHETTLHLAGPWGTVTAFSATTSTHPTATALWTGTAGAKLFFNLVFRGGIIGYIEQIAIHQIG